MSYPPRFGFRAWFTRAFRLWVGKRPICVSLDRRVPRAGSEPAYDAAAYPERQLERDRLGTSNVAPIVVAGRINPALATNNIRVIADTHGRTSHLSAAQVEALGMYLKSLQKLRGLR